MTGNGWITSLRRGDHLVWRVPGGSPVYILVTRVARDTSWADLRMHTWALSWAKRMPLPMPSDNVYFRDWNATDLDRDAEAAMNETREKDMVRRD